MGVTCGGTFACAARAASFVLRVRDTRTLSCGAVWLTLVFVTGETVRSHCFAPRFVTRGRLLTYTSNTSGWPVGEVVVQQETAVAAHAHRRGLGALCVSCCTMTLEAP